MLVFFVEFVVSLHHALHQPNQVTEYLHAADTVEILRGQVSVVQT